MIVIFHLLSHFIGAGLNFVLGLSFDGIFLLVIEIMKQSINLVFNDPLDFFFQELKGMKDNLFRTLKVVNRNLWIVICLGSATSSCGIVGEKRKNNEGGVMLRSRREHRMAKENEASKRRTRLLGWQKNDLSRKEQHERRDRLTKEQERRERFS